MNLYNNIEKFGYTDPEKKCVSLEEYIVFEDEKQLEKYIVFKFRNNLLQVLHEIRFEVCQYDDKKNLVEKNMLFYNNISALPEELFVPNAKLKANYLCKTISVKLIYAKFDTALFENGNLHAANFSFEQYNAQLKRDKKNQMSKKELKEIKKKQKEDEKKLKREKKLDEQFSKIETKNEFLIKEKRVKSKYLKHLFSVKNTSPRNITHGANALLAIGFIALIGFSVWSSLFYRNTSNFYDYNDYTFYSYDNKSAGITKYLGHDSKVIIPSMSKFKRHGELLGPFFGADKNKTEYRNTTKIENECFMNSNVQSILIQNEITIGKKAFYNCKNLNVIYADMINSIEDYAFYGTSLTSFDSSYCATIGENAFGNNKKLLSVNAPNSFVGKDAFKNCDNLRSISIGRTNVSTIGELFGTENNNVPETLTDVYIGQSNFPKEFFYDFNRNVSLHFSDSAYVKKDLYGDNRKFDDVAIKVVDNKLISIASPVLRLNVPSNILDVEDGVENKNYKYLTSVVINSSAFDYATLIRNNPQIKELIFNVDVNIPAKLFAELSSLARLEFNASVTFNEKAPFEKLSGLQWIVISEVNGKFNSLFGNNKDSIHYVVIKDSTLEKKCFEGMSINSLSLVSSSVDDDCLLGAYVLNLYLESIVYEDENKFASSLYEVGTQYVLKNDSHEFDIEHKYEIKTGVYLRNYTLVFNNYSVNVQMYFFTYLPYELNSILYNDEEYMNPSIDLYNYTGAQIYYYGDRVVLK